MTFNIGSYSFTTTEKVKILTHSMVNGTMYRFEGKPSATVKVVDMVLEAITAMHISMNYGVDRFGIYLFIYK